MRPTKCRSATWEAALRVHKALGIERGIIVQTTTYGADHAVVLDALAAMGPNYRGCANALVFAEADDAYLAKLHDAGVRGARFSFRKELGAVLSDADFARAIARIRELGWYAKIQPEKDGIVSSVAKYESLDVPVLIDHMARPDPVRGKDDPNLQKMLELLSKGNFWVMLSLGEKTSKAGPAVGRRHSDRARLYRCRARSLRVGERLAASGLGGAAAQRCRPARTALPLCA